MADAHAEETAAAAHAVYARVEADANMAEAVKEMYIYGTPQGPKLVGIVKKPKKAGSVTPSGPKLLRSKASGAPPHFLPGGVIAPPAREF